MYIKLRRRYKTESRWFWTINREFGICQVCFHGFGLLFNLLWGGNKENTTTVGDRGVW